MIVRRIQQETSGIHRPKNVQDVTREIDTFLAHVRTLPASGTPCLLNASPRHCFSNSPGENIAQLFAPARSAPARLTRALSASDNASNVRFRASRLMSVVVFPDPGGPECRRTRRTANGFSNR